ncbi:MAG: DUF3168 domain-containing protein [Gammaproteobacteria bacterium]
MAIDITQAFFDALSADSNLVALLSTFSGQPAIFTGRTIPPDADRPYVWTVGEASQEPDEEAKDTAARTLVRDIWIVADDKGSADEVEEIAERVREIMHRAALTLGAVQWRTMASGPRMGETDDKSRLQARIVSVRASFFE